MSSLVPRDRHPQSVSRAPVPGAGGAPPVTVWTSVAQADVEKTWDTQLLQFDEQTLYQSSRWGRYKAFRGWRPCHFRAESDGAVVAMLQTLVRTYPWRVVVTWCPGGVVGALDGCSRTAMAQLSSAMGARSMYCRCSFARKRRAADEEWLRANGWTRPARTLSANVTAVWDLRQTEEELFAGMNRNWRYSLRQALKSDLVVERLERLPIGELADLCEAVRASKGAAAVARAPEVAALFDALGHQAVVYGCRNRSGRLIAFHSCAIQGRRAWELIAATSPEGRSVGASFAVLWSLILHCRRVDVTHYDLAGLDPEGAPGVTNFKRWTGAEDIEWLGEWEWSTNAVLRYAVGAAVRSRSDSALP